MILSNNYITENTYFLSDNMYSPIKGKQSTFVCSHDVYEKLVSTNHRLYKINELVDFTFINEVCCNLYSKNMGRPVTNTPEIMFRSAVVQYFYDYSDREMEEAARYNIMAVSYTHLRAHETDSYL